MDSYSCSPDPGLISSREYRLVLTVFIILITNPRGSRFGKDAVTDSPGEEFSPFLADETGSIFS